MQQNQLLEAAAEVLNGSKHSAKSMPPEKLPGTQEDLGGPTPQNSKPTDDSNKVDTNKAAPDTVGHNRGSIKMKPSAASGRIKEDEDKPSLSTIDTDEDYSEDVNSIFEDNLSEEFKEKAKTIFEARVSDRVNQIQENLEAQYATKLEESVQKIQEELAEQVDKYLSYVVDQWLEENKLAIESGLRTELAEEFIESLHNVFQEHYISVPAEKVNLVDSLSEKVVDLEAKLNEQTQKSIEYHAALLEARKSEITHEICEGLTVTQAEKIKSLAESVEFSTEDDFKRRLETIKENYFPVGGQVKKASLDQLNETVEIPEEPKNIHDPLVDLVSKTISRTKLV